MSIRHVEFSPTYPQPICKCFLHRTSWFFFFIWKIWFPISYTPPSHFQFLIPPLSDFGLNVLVTSPRLIEISQIHLWGFSSLQNTNPETKNRSDERLKVYKSIFRKLSSLLLGHEITLMGELNCQECIFKHENLLK